MLDPYIGLCYGPAGVGKTVSARRHAHWGTAEPLLETWGPREDSDAKVYAALARSRAVFYTPEVKATHKGYGPDTAETCRQTHTGCSTVCVQEITALAL